MSFEDQQHEALVGYDAEELALENRRGRAPGKRTLTLGIAPQPIQAHGLDEADHGKAASFKSAGTGRPMPKSIQSQWDSAFKTDFSDVRIHANSPAPKQVGATAFTQGTDIHFAPGKYDPSSQSGKDLIGHELTHVVQQRGGKVQTQAKGGNINADASLEREADEVGARAARGEQVDVSGVGGGIQRQKEAKPASSTGAIAAALTRMMMDGQVEAAAQRAAAEVARIGVEQKLGDKVRSAAEKAANEAKEALIRAATDAKTGFIFTTQHGDGSYKRAVDRQVGQEQRELTTGGTSEASSTEISSIARQEAEAQGTATATQLATALATDTAQQTAQAQLSAAEQSVAQSMLEAARAQIGAVRGTVEASVARDGEGLLVPNPSSPPAGLGEVEPGARGRIERALVARAVDEAVKNSSFVKAAGKVAKRLNTVDQTSATVTERMQSREADLKQSAIVDARQAAQTAVDEIQNESVSDESRGAIEQTIGTITETLTAHCSDKLTATRFHQWGRKRELREQLKAAARQVVNTEIHAQLQQEDRQGREDELTYKETLAKRSAYGEIKTDVNEFLAEVAQGVAARAANDQRLPMAARCREARKTGGDVAATLQAALSDLTSHAKDQANIWIDQLYEAVENGGNITDAAQEASQTEADIAERVREREVAEQVIEAADTEEGVGIIGNLLDRVIPDQGDGVSMKITLKIPILTDPFGGFAAKLNLIAEINGKAGRGTEGFVTAGVPAIASNPNHLELELGYGIGFSLEAGDASTLGFDISAQYNSFVRAGADSTQSAMAAFRYAVYRGTPIKALAGAWYGAFKKGRGPQGVDYQLAEQRAAAVEEQHFMADGKQRTFAQHGRGIGVGASAAANVDGASLGKLGAKGEVSGGFSHFRHFDAETLADRPDTPQNQEEALARRKAMNKGQGSKGKNTLAFSVASEVNLGGIGVGLSGAFSGNDLKNWGVEIKASLSGKLADGMPMDKLITLATSIYELEHRLLSAAGDHLDKKDEMIAKGMSEADIKEKLKSRLLKRTGAQVVQQGGMALASALGVGESSIAASLQFGLSGGSWTTRFDLITNQKIATPDSLPVFGAEINKETRLISAEHQGLSRAAFQSPGVLAQNTDT